jgi:hypothetical protein
MIVMLQSWIQVVVRLDLISDYRYTDWGFAIFLSLRAHFRIITVILIYHCHKPMRYLINTVMQTEYDGRHCSHSCPFMQYTESTIQVKVWNFLSLDNIKLCFGVLQWVWVRKVDKVNRLMQFSWASLSVRGNVQHSCLLSASCWFLGLCFNAEGESCTSSSKMPDDFQQTTWHYIPEYMTLQRLGYLTQYNSSITDVWLFDFQQV